MFSKFLLKMHLSLAYLNSCTHCWGLTPYNYPKIIHWKRVNCLSEKADQKIFCLCAFKWRTWRPYPCRRYWKNVNIFHRIFHFFYSKNKFEFEKWKTQMYCHFKYIYIHIYILVYYGLKMLCKINQLYFD